MLKSTSLKILAGAAAITSAAVAVAATPAQATHTAPKFAFCAGVVPTIISANPVIVGTDGDDVILAIGGIEHTIFGYGGDDLICGDTARDYIYGGRGNDRLYGNRGNDFLFGEAGSDTLYGSSGHDRLYGHAGNDVLHGNSGNDLVVGNAGRDYLEGNEGNDRVDAVTGDDGKGDTALGGDGDDFVNVRDGVANDVGSGGAGVDTCWGDAGEICNP